MTQLFMTSLGNIMQLFTMEDRGLLQLFIYRPHGTNMLPASTMGETAGQLLYPIGPCTRAPSVS